MADARSAELLSLRQVADAACAFIRGTGDREALERAVEGYEKLPRKGVLRVRRARGVGGLTSYSEGTPPQAPKSTEDPNPTSRSDVSTPRTTWLTPYIDAYTKHYSERPSPVSIKRMARTFKDMETFFPRAEILQRFTAYLASNPGRYYSVEHFANTYAEWSVERRTADRRRDDLTPLPNETTDQYMARVAARR